MPTALEHTIWPDTPIEPEAKNLIALFFRVVDLKDPDSGKQLAEEVFTPDGKMITANGTFHGEAGASRVSPVEPFARFRSLKFHVRNCKVPEQCVDDCCFSTPPNCQSLRERCAG